MAYCKILLPDGVTELANIKSVIFHEAVNSGVDLRPGCVGSASIEVEVFNTQPNAVAAGDALKYYQIDKNNTQTLIGTFYAEPVIATKNSYRFVAYDAAYKLNADFSAWLRANQSNFPMTIKSLVTAACTAAGVTLGSSSWSLSTQNVQAFYADGITCRNILEYAAELGCKFVRCHTDEKVYFDWYTTKANKRIYPSSGVSGSETRYAYKQDGLQYTNYTTTAIARVAVHPSGENDVAYIYPTGVNSGNTLNITNNLLLTGASSSLFNSAAQTIYTALNSLGTYRPATAHLFPRENPFRAGDIVSVTDSQGVSFRTVVMESSVSESDAILTSTGNQTYDEGSGNAAKSLTQLASDVVQINKLKVDWADIGTAIVDYLDAHDITAQNLTIVDENGNVLATYNSSGVVLGKTNQCHADIDFHSLKLYDASGNVYVNLEDLRGADGTYEYVETFDIQEATNRVTVENKIYSIVSITRNGYVVSPSHYYHGTFEIAFDFTLSVGDSVAVDYKCDTPMYSYTFGDRYNGTDIGKFSFMAGENSSTEGIYSAVIGGIQNHARSSCAVVVGGLINYADGENSVIIGGNGSSAKGVGCVVLGKGTKATHKSQFVFGEYNEADPSVNDSTDRGDYVEIVGNGADGSSRSNARTLDWSGNEVLAGGLTTGDDVSITGDVSATGDASVGGDLDVTGGLSLGTALPVASGGTGADTATVAKENLGINDAGMNFTVSKLTSAGQLGTLNWTVKNTAATGYVDHRVGLIAQTDRMFLYDFTGQTSIWYVPTDAITNAILNNSTSYASRTAAANAIWDSMDDGKTKIGRVNIGGTNYAYWAMRNSANYAVATLMTYSGALIYKYVKTNGTVSGYKFTGTADS